MQKTGVLLQLSHRWTHSITPAKAYSDPPSVTQVLLSRMRHKMSSFQYSYKTPGAFHSSTDVRHHYPIHF